MPLVKVDGADASVAWTAYLRNRSKFGTDSLHHYAQGLSHPDRVYLILPAGGITSMMACSAKVWGSEASGVLAVGPPIRHKHRNILLLHVRTHMHGAGQGSQLLTAAQQDVVAEKLATLSTSAPACRTWYATLLLLRHGFTGDQNLLTAVIQLPTVTVPHDAVAITFTWEPTHDTEEQIRYVEQVRDAQRTRKQDDFADALTEVVRYLSRDR